LVLPDNEVQNRIVELPRAVDACTLEQAANYLNRHCAGQDFAQIRQHLLAELQHTKTEMDALLNAAMAVSGQMLNEPPRPDGMLLSGQTRLMGAQGLSDMERLKSLFEAFSSQREILAPLSGCTVITAPYASQGRVLGVLGVIGPTRMPYERVIPIVKATADLLGDALKLA
jgi:heat-inducible transcriptional repressor